MHAHEEWVSRSIDLGLCNADAPWIGHIVTALGGTPELNNRVVGSFTRAEIENFRARMEGYRFKVSETHNAEFQRRATQDLDALEVAGNTLQELKDHVRREHLRQLELIEQPQASAPPMAPPMPAKPDEEGEAEEAAEEEDYEKETGDHMATGIMQASETQESSVPAEVTAELERFNTDLAPLLVQRQSGLSRASFGESSAWLVQQCQSSYERLREQTDVNQITNEIHAQKLATEWASEIGLELEHRDKIDRNLIRSVRRLGQVRAFYRKNGQLKRGKAGKGLFVQLDKHLLQQSDKLAKIEDDDDFETRLKAKRPGELTKYSTLENTPPPKEQPESNSLYRTFSRICKNPVYYAEGRYKEENSAAWADLRGHHSEIRSFAIKLIEFLDFEIR